MFNSAICKSSEKDFPQLKSNLVLVWLNFPSVLPAELFQNVWEIKGANTQVTRFKYKRPPRSQSKRFRADEMMKKTISQLVLLILKCFYFNKTNSVKCTWEEMISWTLASESLPDTKRVVSSGEMFLTSHRVKPAGNSVCLHWFSCILSSFTVIIVILCFSSHFDLQDWRVS